MRMNGNKAQLEQAHHVFYVRRLALWGIAIAIFVRLSLKVKSNRRPMSLSSLSTLQCPEWIELPPQQMIIGRDSGSPTHRTTVSIPSLDACALFSDTYKVARSKFRRAAGQVAGAELYQLPVHVPRDKTGDYTIDVAVLPGGKSNDNLNHQRYLIHSSGVHGVEGYAGSAIQIAFLQSYPHIITASNNNNSVHNQSSSSQLPTIILIHAFNPFGMAHNRRVNENNVDLNRNGLVDHDIVRGDAHYNHRSYSQFLSLFEPNTNEYSHRQLSTILPIQIWWRMFPSLLKYGLKSLKSAMVGGQYHSPRGIFYGGTQLEKSYRVLGEWLTEYLNNQQRESFDSSLSTSLDGVDNVEQVQQNSHPPPSQLSRSQKKVVTWIDVHTGLGVFGEDTIHSACQPTIVDNDKSNKEEELYYARIRQWFPDSHHTTPSSSDHVGQSMASGYERVVGELGQYFQEFFHEEMRVRTTKEGNVNNDSNNNNPSVLVPSLADDPLDRMFVVQEFGTIASPRVGHALMFENAVYQHYMMMKKDTTTSTTTPHPDDDDDDNGGGTVMDSSAWTKWILRPAFYPDHARWRESIIQKGMRVMVQGMTMMMMSTTTTRTESTIIVTATAMDD